MFPDGPTRTQVLFAIDDAARIAIYTLLPIAIGSMISRLGLSLYLRHNRLPNGLSASAISLMLGMLLPTLPLWVALVYSRGASLDAVLLAAVIAGALMAPIILIIGSMLAMYIISTVNRGERVFPNYVIYLVCATCLVGQYAYLWWLGGKIN